MSGPDQTPSIHPIESKELITPTQGMFFQLGGTWMMEETSHGREGKGNLDDAAIRAKELELGTATAEGEALTEKEREMTYWMWDSFQNTPPEEMSDRLSHFSELSQRIKGPYYPLYSADSSHFRNSLIVPTVKFVLDKQNQNPNRVALIGLGTDFKDIGYGRDLDVMLFDTDLPGVFEASANDPASDPESDAYQNFNDMGYVASTDIGVVLAFFAKRLPYSKEPDPKNLYKNPPENGSGVFALFEGQVFSAVDLVKFDPFGSREGVGTFLQPKSLGMSVDQVRKAINAGYQWHHCKSAPPEHVSRNLDLDRYFNALNNTHIVNLGNRSDPAEVRRQILDSPHQGIVVSTHSMGNADNLTRAFCVEAVKRGKTVVITSRVARGDVNTKYAAGIMSANEEGNELGNSSDKLIGAGKIPDVSAKALLARSILEGSKRSEETRLLFEKYEKARFGHYDDEGKIKEINEWDMVRSFM